MSDMYKNKTGNLHMVIRVRRDKNPVITNVIESR
jgi:hypothetical protein